MAREKKGFWFKKDEKLTVFVGVTQGERGYTVYYRGTCEDDALYIGCISRVRGTPYNPEQGKTQIGRVKITFRDKAGTARYCISTWDDMDEALAYAKTWFPKFIDLFISEAV